MPHVTGTLESKAYQETKEGKEFAVIEVLPEGEQYALKIRDFNGRVRGTPGLTKGIRVTAEFAEKPGTYEGKAITYRNLISITKGAPPAAGAPPAVTAAEIEEFEAGFHSDTQPGRTTATPVASKPAAGVGGYTNDGAAYGAAQHAASRVLSAWVLKHGVPPDAAQQEALVKALTDMTDKAYKQRLPL